MIIVVELILFPVLILCVSDDTPKHSSETNETFAWENLIDWPSSPERDSNNQASKDMQISKSESQPESVSTKLSYRGVRDPEKMRIHNSNSYYKTRNDPKQWKYRLDSQRLNRFKRKRREAAKLLTLPKEEQEKILLERKQKSREKYFKNKNNRIQKGQTPSKTTIPARDLSPKSLKNRRDQNREAARRYREKKRKNP